jgi:hypothetical protein
MSDALVLQKRKKTSKEISGRIAPQPGGDRHRPRLDAARPSASSISSFREPNAINTSGWWSAILQPFTNGFWTLQNYVFVITEDGMGERLPQQSPRHDPRYGYSDHHRCLRRVRSGVDGVCRSADHVRPRGGFDGRAPPDVTASALSSLQQRRSSTAPTWGSGWPIPVSGCPSRRTCSTATFLRSPGI